MRMKSKKDGTICRREFLRRASALGIGGLSTPALMSTLMESPARAAAQAASKQPPLDIAEWSFFWVGVEREQRAGSGGQQEWIVNGKQMYVEYQIPARVRHPYPIVLVHGGGGQGLDWMATPDGR